MKNSNEQRSTFKPGMLFCSISAVLLAALVFAYFHSRSVDRALLVNSANDLLVAVDQLREHGTVTNTSKHTRIYFYTNEVSIRGTQHFCILAADAPGLTNAGTLAATKDGTLIWINQQGETSIVRGTDGTFVMPKQFKDF